MTRFCQCNSRWSNISEMAVFCGGIIINSKTKEYAKCNKCGFYTWYDPYYENMMKDLKEMNKQ